MSGGDFPIMLPGYGSDTKDILMAIPGPIYTRVPWGMMAQHEGQARRNHGQTLEQLASRHGLSACEAVAVLEDRGYRSMSHTQAYALLAEHITRWSTGVAYPKDAA